MDADSPLQYDLRRALEEFVVDGIETTIPLHRELIAASDFVVVPGRCTKTHGATLATVASIVGSESSR